MAAEVVVPFGRLADDEREKSRAERRHKRRRTSFVGKYGVATTPREKLDAAADYFRGVIADHHVNQVKAGIAAEHLADQLIASADQLAKTVGRKR
jgi:hypothetical protein